MLLSKPYEIKASVRKMGWPPKPKVVGSNPAKPATKNDADSLKNKRIRVFRSPAAGAAGCNSANASGAESGIHEIIAARIARIDADDPSQIAAARGLDGRGQEVERGRIWGRGRRNGRGGVRFIDERLNFSQGRQAPAGVVEV
jgi:hypothetical protein